MLLCKTLFISGITYSRFGDKFKRSKMFASNKEGSEVKNMIRSINKLSDIYK
ncbi:hypothetical protein [Borreliella turdi]|uniref:hypothetical protein n=1 Tax=Borreliella turdi TaxID=57863 RepID=UPI001562CED2|nr:hypothetical protein [Borreliella turdi]